MLIGMNLESEMVIVWVKIFSSQLSTTLTECIEYMYSIDLYVHCICMYAYIVYVLRMYRMSERRAGTRSHIRSKTKLDEPY